MAQQVQDPIYFLITDLALPKGKVGLVLKRLKELNPFKHVRGSKKLLSLYHFAPVKHWAVRIRDYCYEVNSEYSEEKKKNVFVLHKQMHIADWVKMCEEKEVSWEHVEVGATTQSDDTISQQADMVWSDHLRVKYKLLSQNCQNFAYCLYRMIAVDPEKVDDDVRRAWKRVPNRVTQYKTVLKRAAPMLARGLVIEGIELSVEGAALIGLEAVGLSLLGPVGEIILVASILAPLFLAKSNDTKWLKLHGITKVTRKQKGKLGPATETENHDNMLIERQMEEVIREIAEQPSDKEVSPLHEFDHWETSEEGTTVTDVDSPDSRYQGYNKQSTNKYARLGFPVEHVVAVFQEWGIDTGEGDEFSFSEVDHQKMINSLLGHYGFDEIFSAKEPTTPCKALLESAVPDDWALQCNAHVSTLGVEKTAGLTTYERNAAVELSALTVA